MFDFRETLWELMWSITYYILSSQRVKGMVLPFCRVLISSRQFFFRWVLWRMSDISIQNEQIKTVSSSQHTTIFYVTWLGKELTIHTTWGRRILVALIVPILKKNSNVRCEFRANYTLPLVQKQNRKPTRAFLRYLVKQNVDRR